MCFINLITVLQEIFVVVVVLWVVKNTCVDIVLPGFYICKAILEDSCFWVTKSSPCLFESVA